MLTTREKSGVFQKSIVGAFNSITNAACRFRPSAAVCELSLRPCNSIANAACRFRPSAAVCEFILRPFNIIPAEHPNRALGKLWSLLHVLEPTFPN